jgi:hypothetical protein
MSKMNIIRFFHEGHCIKMPPKILFLDRRKRKVRKQQDISNSQFQMRYRLTLEYLQKSGGRKDEEGGEYLYLYIGEVG